MMIKWYVVHFLIGMISVVGTGLVWVLIWRDAAATATVLAAVLNGLYWFIRASTHDFAYFPYLRMNISEMTLSNWIEFVTGTAGGIAGLVAVYVVLDAL